ncbi:hypothetical protein ACFPU0_04715 [Pseudomonas sp. GCM10022186]|uniref:hypothetical protein n=1 Tax=Pseudomonas sp. GCM10022186 TaxID=3252650 RepID=UPI003622E297
MNFIEAIELASNEAPRIIARNAPRSRKDVLQNESLFHMPLIALTILMLSKGKAKPRLDEIGMLVGVCFERSLATFNGSSQELGWSANLRIRTVKALTFLEAADLVTTNKSTSRLEATDNGKKIIDSIIREETKLCVCLLSIQRAYRNVCKERAAEAKL